MAESESVALLKAKLRDSQAECARMHAENMMLVATVAALQNDIFKLHETPLAALPETSAPQEQQKNDDDQSRVDGQK